MALSIWRGDQVLTDWDVALRFADPTIAPWFWRVDPDTLDMRSRTRCLVAQALGKPYDEVITTLRLTPTHTARLGFAPRVYWPYWGRFAFMRLTRKWRRHIRHLRKLFPLEAS